MPVRDTIAADVPCENCGLRQSRVVDTRGTISGSVRRRRECLHCGARYTTYENRGKDVHRLMERMQEAMRRFIVEIPR